MANAIPNPVIGTVASVLSDCYSGTVIDRRFMLAGAPGDPPWASNKEKKCQLWMQQCSVDPSIDALAVLGSLVKEIMEEMSSGNRWRPQITVAFEKSGLRYMSGGSITAAGTSSATRTLRDFLNGCDYKSIDAEFSRATSQLNSDPQAAITAACALIEATCKVYIEESALAMPSDQTVKPLWRVVRDSLGLSFDRQIADDQKKILGGLGSIVDGIGCYRTHTGSAHGRGLEPPKIDISEARLAVNASHTLVTFIMERWHASRA